jgi:phosphatidylserine/phosphatidylglycerophosphate/cardiolipin synthase-like enzyme
MSNRAVAHFFARLPGPGHLHRPPLKRRPSGPSAAGPGCPATRWLRRHFGAALCAAALALAGCSSLPKNVLRPVSHALATPEATPLGKLAEQRRPRNVDPAVSGFALLASPKTAFGARLALTEQATQTLDIQYYAIHSDPSVTRLFQAVRAAAARGVRVRILLDDFNSVGRDAQVMRMASVPGVQMRMFNPLTGSRATALLRALGSMHDFDRIQHRMHNKVYVADNAWGIVGGRNLGDAYFGTADGSDFIDMDVLAAGPVVQAISASFDRFWNNPLAYPVAALITPAQLAHLRTVTRPEQSAQASQAAPDPAASKPAATNPVADKPTHAPPAALDLAALPLDWAPAGLLVDSPLKLAPATDGGHADDTVIAGLLSLLRSARHSATIVSAYFVPGKPMMALFAALQARGVRVRVLTNSLASTDALLAQVGYTHHRKQLLRLGVDLYEMRALGRAGLKDTVLGSASSGSRASLHAKLVIVDDRIIDVGSLNLDLRSKLQNSEIALVIRSPALAQQAVRQVDAVLSAGAWQVTLAPDGTLHWRTPAGATFRDVDHEPDTSFWLRLLALLLSPLAPDEML